jgi:ribosomal protein S18 acetylase RimI-like enzyme
LLAIAVCQPTPKSTDPPPSRASSLLQGFVVGWRIFVHRRCRDLWWVWEFAFTAGAGICGGQTICVQTSTLWVPSLLAIAVCQPTFKSTATPPSRASSAPTVFCNWSGNLRSPQVLGFVVGRGLVFNPQPCRSEPARDSGKSANIKSTDPPLSRASSAPTGICVGQGICVHRRCRDLGWAENLCSTHTPVGAELARDSDLSVNIQVD